MFWQLLEGMFEVLILNVVTLKVPKSFRDEILTSLSLISVQVVSTSTVCVEVKGLRCKFYFFIFIDFYELIYVEKDKIFDIESVFQYETLNQPCFIYDSRSYNRCVWQWRIASCSAVLKNENGYRSPRCFLACSDRSETTLSYQISPRVQGNAANESLLHTPLAFFNWKDDAATSFYSQSYKTSILVLLGW